MVFVYILGKVEPGKEAEILNALERAEQVKKVSRTYGFYDLCIEAEAKTLEELDDFVFNVVRKIKDVKETVTLVASKVISKEV